MKDYVLFKLPSYAVLYRGTLYGCLRRLGDLTPNATVSQAVAAGYIIQPAR